MSNTLYYLPMRGIEMTTGLSQRLLGQGYSTVRLSMNRKCNYSFCSHPDKKACWLGSKGRQYA